MATHRIMDGSITITTDEDSGLIVMRIRDDTGREVEVSMTPKASRVLRGELRDHERVIGDDDTPEDDA